MAMVTNKAVVSDDAVLLISLVFLLAIVVVAVASIVWQEMKAKRQRKIFDAVNVHLKHLSEMDDSPESVDRVIASYKELIKFDAKRYGGEEEEKTLIVLQELRDSLVKNKIEKGRL